MFHLGKTCSFFALTAAALLLTAWAGTAFAQDSNESVAEAAKKAREQKKDSKLVKTFTNDDLPKAPESDAIPKLASPADATATTADSTEKKDDDAAAKDQKRVKKAESADDAAQKKAEAEAQLESAKKELKQAAGELDIMQRKLALDNDSYYSKTDFASDTDGKAALDAEAQQITDKKDAVEKLKAHVAELQAKVDELSGGAAPASEPNKDQTQGKNPPPQP